ncbi:MAG: hypothetical protein NTZ56_14435 [Acidobacteria bacterium]|nr:hypothetical protein [Acidobacteriota bacterium]
MAKVVMIRNPHTGVVKKGFYGFSWTYLFFGWFVPLIRGELGVAALHLLFSLCTLGIWQIVVAFLYNKQYTIRNLEKGYILHDDPRVVSEAQWRLGVTEVARGASGGAS